MHEVQQIACQVTEYLRQTICFSGSLTPETDLLEEGLADFAGSFGAFCQHLDRRA